MLHEISIPRDTLASQSRVSFRRNFLWVTLVHVVVILGFALWTMARPKEKPIETLQWINPGLMASGPVKTESATTSIDLPAPPIKTKGSAAPPVPAPEPPAPPAPRELTPPVQEVKPQIPDVVDETVAPPPVETDIPLTPVKPKPAPAVKKSTSTTPPKPAPAESDSASNDKPAPAKPNKIKVNLTAIKRTTGTTGNGNSTSRGSNSRATATASQAEGEGEDEISTGELASRLSGAVARAGGGNGSGTAAAGSGNGSAQRGEYISLMTQEILAHWQDRAQWIATRLRPRIAITVAKDGTISNVSLVQSSGNSELDQSVIAAIHKTARFSEPPPTGLNPVFNVTVK